MTPTKRDILKIYGQAVRPYVPLVVLMFLGVTGAAAVGIITPLFYKRFFNLLSGTIPSASGDISVDLIRLIIAILGMNIAAWVLYRACAFSNSFVQPRIMADLTERGYDYLQRHSYRFFAGSFVGSLVRKVTKLPRAFENFSDRIFWDFYPLAVRIIVAIGILFTIHQTIAIALLVWTVAFMGINIIFANWKLKYDNKKSEKDTETVGVLADAITNATNIQLFTGYAFEFARVRKVAEELRRLHTFTWNLHEVAISIQAALFVAIEFVIMYLAIPLWQDGMLTVGDFVLIQSYLINFIGHLWDFGRHIRSVYESFADAEEMVGVLNTPHEVKDVPEAKPLVVTRGAIDFDHVSFGYNKTRSVLKGVILAIRPQEKVALIGPSGAGKSTLVKLLLRFYDVSDGKILVDDQKIHQVTQESLRSAVALVPQDPIMFHRTIRENIRYGRRTATDAEVEEAARAAHCMEFISELPHEWDTFVGERGIKLSGGERQRVAIARAILKNAPILVLDEATSSLDSESELLIQDALRRLMEQKTVLVIAHRLSTIRMMDRIVVIDKGMLQDEGTHDELLKKNGMYARLWKLQAGGFIGDPAKTVT